MKSLVYALLLSLSFTAGAGVYEIPVADEDFTPLQTRVDHTSFRVKPFNCAGRTFGILYQTFSGYSQGSTLIAVCAIEKSESPDACRAEDSLYTRFCYNRVVRQYGLEDRHPLASAPVRIQRSSSSIW